jgi:hypothetical protein
MLVGLIWVRATLPRFRYDRLMAFGWKVMLPLAFISVAWTAISLVVGDSAGSPLVYAITSGIFFVVLVVAAYFILNDRDDRLAPETSLADDPVVTGERKGVMPVLIDALGTPISLLYGIFDKMGPRLQRAREGTVDTLRDFSKAYSGDTSKQTDEDESKSSESASGD